MANKKKLLKIYADNSTPDELFSDTLEKIEKIKGELSEIVDDKIHELESEVKDVLEYIDRNKPKTEEELLVLITPLIKDGHTPTDEELLDIILPLIPKVENGKPGKKGKDGTEIKPEEVRDKLKELKGVERLSVFDLKDTEWLKGKWRDQIQWNSVGGITAAEVQAIVNNAISGAPSKGSIIATTNLGDDQNYQLASALTTSSYYIILNQGYYLPSDVNFPYSITGLILTFVSPLPTDLASKQLTVICV